MSALTMFILVVLALLAVFGPVALALWIAAIAHRRIDRITRRMAQEIREALI